MQPYDTHSTRASTAAVRMREFDSAMEIEGCSGSEFYSAGRTINLFLDKSANRSIPAKVIKTHQPFTLSCVATVEVAGADLGFIEPKMHAVLKLYDRRFAEQLRQDEGISPWSEDIEWVYLEFVASGDAAEFLRRLREDDDFEEPDEGWSAAENETYLYNMCSDLFSTEQRAYETLKQLQGKQIPAFYSAVTLPFNCGVHGRPIDVQAARLLEVKGILLEYIAGPTLSHMINIIPRQSWQHIVDQAVQIIRSYSRLGILNKDVRCSNFIVNEAVSDGDERRVVMLDFALCDFKGSQRSQTDWGRAKWSQDEEGAVGAVMKTRLSKLGFQLDYTPSLDWIEYAEREEDNPSV